MVNIINENEVRDENSKEEFREFFDNELFPKHKKRLVKESAYLREAYKQVGKGLLKGLAIGIPVSLVFGLLMSLLGVIPTFISSILEFALVVVIVVHFIKSTVNNKRGEFKELDPGYKVGKDGKTKSMKEYFYVDIFKFFSLDLVYEENGGIRRNTFRKTKLVKSSNYGTFGYGDAVHGEVAGRRFTVSNFRLDKARKDKSRDEADYKLESISEEYLIRKTSTNKFVKKLTESAIKTHRERALFNGYMIELEMPTRKEVELLVRNNKFGKTTNTSRTKSIGDPHFDKYYSIEANDTIVMNQLLQPRNLEMIKKVSKSKFKNLSISMTNGILYIMYEDEYNIFESGRGKDIDADVIWEIVESVVSSVKLFYLFDNNLLRDIK